MKKTLPMLLIVPLVWMVFISSVFAQERIPTFHQLNRLGLERVWWAQATINPNRDKVKHVVIDEEAVYVQASSGVTTAFDAETGRHKWSAQVGRYDQPSFAAVSNEELVLIVSSETLYALEKKSGRTAWTLKLDGVPSTSPSVDEKQIYFGTINGFVYAYSLKRVRKLYEERRLPAGSYEAQVWSYRAEKQITSPPIVTGKAVNFASQNGSLYSVSSFNRQLNYILETNKPIVAPLARMGNSMFMASEDHSVFGINLENGVVEWEFTSGLPIRKAIWAVDRDLYLFPDRGGMVCLNPKNGARRWSHPNLSNFLAVLGQTLAAFDAEGNLVVLDRDKGAIIGSLPTHHFSVRTGNDCTNRIYLATENGLIVCLRKPGDQDPIYHRHPDRLPLSPEFTPDENSGSVTDPDSHPDGADD